MSQEGHSPANVGAPNPPSADTEPEVCPICHEEYGLDEYGVNRVPYMIYCGHIYCHECISVRYHMDPREWNGDCPLCRRNLIHEDPRCRHLCPFQPAADHSPLDPSHQLHPLCIDCQVRDTLENMDTRPLDDADPVYKAERDSIRQGYMDVITLEAEGDGSQELRERCQRMDTELDLRTRLNQWNAVVRLRARLHRERW